MSSFDTNRDERGFKLFGFEIRRSREKEKQSQLQSIVPPADDDGAGYVTAAGAHYGTYMDIGDDNRKSKDDRQMIMEYRAVSHHPEVDEAIENIVNETITTNSNEPAVQIVLDDVEASDSIKKQVIDEFDVVIGKLNFQELGHDIFRRWYIDGRLYFHLVIDEKNPKAGIQDVRPIDASKMRKVKEIKRKKDPVTGASIVERVDEFYIFQDKPTRNITTSGGQTQGVRLSPDSVVYVTSGLLDEQRKKVVSHLHKALRTINQLRMMEDALVIYRLSRAPERRVFYVDVGNLPKAKADEYMKGIMSRYRNKLVYDGTTGQIRDDRKHMSMLEDFWLPRREGGRGTEVTTLPGGENLGQLDDVEYFRKKLFRALNVPVQRLEPENQFSLGRTTEVTRDELKFQKFIDRLRTRFNHLFLDILKKQLLLKGIITDEDWEDWKVSIQVDYSQDNHFTELKNTEVLRERVQTLDMIQQYVGEYFSHDWVWRNVLQLNDEEIDEMKKEIKAESKDEEQEQADQQDEIDPNQQFTVGAPDEQQQ